MCRYDFSGIFGYPKGPEEIANMPLIYITLLIGTIIGYFISKLVVKFCSNRIIRKCDALLNNKFKYKL